MIIKFGTYYESQPIKLGYNKNGKPIKEEIKTPEQQAMQTANEIFEKNQHSVEDYVKKAGTYSKQGTKK